MLDKYGADAWRYLAAGSKLGENIPYQEKDLQTGKRTITKLWNAAKFCAIHLENYKPKKVELEPFDKWILTKLNTLIKNATASFEDYEYSKVRAETDEFFWKILCDNYLEIVKDRLYNPDRRGQQAKESAQYTLYHSLLTVVKLFAPIMPHVTEEIYHELFKEEKSVHLSNWPEQHNEWNDKKLEKIGNQAIEIISLVRQEKTKSQKSLKEPVKNLTLPNALKVIEQDLKAVSQAQTIKYGKQLSIEL